MFYLLHFYASNALVSYVFFYSRFKLNMNRLQNLIMDQPISNSVERATWWIEYVIRNNGTVSIIFFLIIN